jgi:hypothetical protein
MAPSKARRKKSLREITTIVATGPIANSQPASSTLTKEEGQQEEQYPKEPKIPPLPPITVNLVPQQGLGCEAVEGLLVPSRNREYKPSGKYIVGNHPIYAIGFNFMDVRYYDVFAAASGNSVSSRLLPTSRLLSFYLLEVRGVVYDEWQIEGMPLVVFGCWFGIRKGFEYGLGCVAF